MVNPHEKENAAFSADSVSSFSESTEKAALKQATKQKKTEEEKDLAVLMWTDFKSLELVF